MQSLDELLAECESLHGHMCPGQLLGARMAMLGCASIAINDPKGSDRKKLIVWVEIDRCMADAISASTGVRLGKRSLKFVDYGKVAATFLNTDTNEAVRVVALESSRSLADERHPEITSKSDRQFRTYHEARDDELFKTQKVVVKYNDYDMPGRPRSRIECNQCGEGVNDGREFSGTDDSAKLCRACAGGGYYQVQD